MSALNAAVTVIMVGAGISTFATTARWIVPIVAPPAIEGWAEWEGPVTAGEHVPIPWTIIKRTPCAGFASRVWVGEDGFRLIEPVTITILPMDPEPREYVFETTIPTLAPKGDLQMTVEGFYECDERSPDYFTLGPVNFTVL